jgi:hypothetical protein
MMQPKLPNEEVVSGGQSMASADMKRAFNEWMRRYTEEPERFQAEFKTVGAFLAESADGKEPSYGETSAAYMFSVLTDLNAVG